MAPFLDAFAKFRDDGTMRWGWMADTHSLMCALWLLCVSPVRYSSLCCALERRVTAVGHVRCVARLRAAVFGRTPGGQGRCPIRVEACEQGYEQRNMMYMTLAVCSLCCLVPPAVMVRAEELAAERAKEEAEAKKAEERKVGAMSRVSVC